MEGSKTIARTIKQQAIPYTCVGAILLRGDPHDISCAIQSRRIGMLGVRSLSTNPVLIPTLTVAVDTGDIWSSGIDKNVLDMFCDKANVIK
jgi:hypothetical protein